MRFPQSDSGIPRKKTPGRLAWELQQNEAMTNASGMTLIEVLVAMAVAAVLTVGAGGLLVASARVVTEGQAATTGALLVSQKLEQLRASAAATREGEERLTIDGRVLTGAGAAGAYIRRWAAVPVAEWPGVWLAEVELLTSARKRVVRVRALVERPSS